MGAEWVEAEMRTLHLADARHTERAKKMLASFSEQPGKSIPEACVTWGATKGAYCFLGNRRVDEAQIRLAHNRATAERVGEAARILAIQDTSELNYTGKAVAEGMGSLANQYTRGLLMHSVLAVSVTGVPLGVVDQNTWSRDLSTQGKRKDRRKKTTEDKESQRWLDGVHGAEECLTQAGEIVHIADREGDIYALLAVARQPRSQLLIRVKQNRRVEGETRYLWEAIRQTPPSGVMTVQVKAQADREARQATLTVRFRSLTVRPPHQKAGAGVTLQFILAEEQDPPPGAEKIEWLLATTLPVATLEEAMTVIGYYSLRWLIERFHYVLKSGCQIEELYLQTQARLLRALALYSIVAWRVLWLTYEARQSPDQSCTILLQTHEWQALYCSIHKTPVPPATPPTLLEAVIWIARLGGFLARKNDGFPGPKTIWRGLRRLDDIADTWLLLHSPSTKA